jgi:predicted outer membrane protein
MSAAASSALFAIRASRMAEARATAPKLRAFASKVVVDQTGISAQLGFAGRKIDLLPSSQPMPVHQAMLDELATSTDFDGTYRRQLALVLTQAEAVHRTFEERGSDPTLRPVAIMAAPIYRKNLEQLHKL